MFCRIFCGKHFAAVSPQLVASLPKLRADLKTWVVPPGKHRGIEVRCIQISPMQSHWLFGWLEMVTGGHGWFTEKNVLRYIRLRHQLRRDGITVSKCTICKYFLQNNGSYEPAQAFLSSNPQWIWPSPPAELLLKVCALVFEVTWVLTKQGVNWFGVCSCFVTSRTIRTHTHT